MSVIGLYQIGKPKTVLDNKPKSGTLLANNRLRRFLLASFKISDLLRQVIADLNSSY
jgi:hypothetical protein